MKSIKDKFINLDGEHLYHDAGVIHLLHSVRDLRHYSPSSFDLIVKTCDKFMYYAHLCSEDPKEISACFDRMVELKKSILNQMGSFYLKVQEMEEEKQLNKAIDSMRFLLNIHLSEIKLLNKQNPINRNYKDVCEHAYDPHDFGVKHPVKDVNLYHQLF